eukprot:TRINITY_DN77787_c0_g1_i1.p1 TRINITY_DN77787_c0_g1~~TRINITY_DN77787_c0_g1_i1.p1  ORF type:complete len:382 (+),score=79.71 TRINITY_DN77787_c0_g1_i1:36-1148(+)
MDDIARPVRVAHRQELISFQSAEQLDLAWENDYDSETLCSVSINLHVRPSAESFQIASRRIPGQTPLLRCFTDGKGFRIDLQPSISNQEYWDLVLLVGAGVNTWGEVDFWEVVCKFNKAARQGRWSRINAVIGPDMAGQQRAHLYLDEVDGTQDRRRICYQPPRGTQVTLGGETFRGDMKDVHVYRGLATLEYMAIGLQADMIQASHLLARSSALWSEEAFRDCTVTTEDGGRWQVHRCVLAAASPVLRRMLSGGMQETSTSCIVIRDAAKGDVEAFLEFLYLGRLREQEAGKSRSACCLLALADMYDVPGLKQLMLHECERELSPDNVVDIVRTLRKRKHAPDFQEAYRRISRRIKESDVLHECLLDSL